MPRWLWAVALLGVVVVLVDVGAFGAWLLFRGAPAKPVVYSPDTHPTSPWRGTSTPPFDVGRDEPNSRSNGRLPAVKRNVPVLDARLLDGCSKTDLDTVESSIGDAIEIGAPKYNEGDFDGCYRTYESAALGIERSLSGGGKTCKGPGAVLKSGRERAAKLTKPAEQAWAMRDAFDGLLDVIDRRGPEL
jgi:hypothetical protein